MIPITMPPLRDRRDDILPLVAHYIDHFNREFGKTISGLAPDAEKALTAYAWPGNVRELKNVIERAVILSNGGTLRLGLSLPETGLPAAVAATTESAGESSTFMTEKELKDLQKKNLQAALQHAGWRVSGQNGAAELLGIRPTTLADRIKSFGIKKPSG